MTTHPDIQAAQKKQHLAGVFNRAAATYDQIGPAFFAHFGRRLVELAQIPAGAQVLDVATGRGAVFFPTAQAVGLGGYVTGIDLSERMVEETSRELTRRGITNGEIRQMDAEHLLSPDHTFDYLVSGFSLFFFPHLDAALAEFRRVLKPSGRIAVSTWSPYGDDDWKWFRDLCRSYVPPDPEEPKTSQHIFDTPEGMRAIMSSVGLAVVRVFNETADFVYANEDEWWSSLWSHGTRNSLERIENAAGPEGLARLKASALERLRTIKQADGIHRPMGALFTLAVKPSSLS